MADPRPPDPLTDKQMEQYASDERTVRALTYFEWLPLLHEVRNLRAANAELRAANADLILQRDKAERQRSEAFTQQDTRLEFCRKELAEAAQEINCAGPVAHRIRVMKQEWSDTLAAASQREAALREALEKIQKNLYGPYVLQVIRAALSGASSPATSTKEK